MMQDREQYNVTLAVGGPHPTASNSPIGGPVPMSSSEGIHVGSRLFLTAAPDLAAGSRSSPGHWMRDMLSWTLAHSQEGSVSWQPEATHVIVELTGETVRLR